MYGELGKKAFFWILKRRFICWITCTSQNVQKLQIFAILASFLWGNLKRPEIHSPDGLNKSEQTLILLDRVRSNLPNCSEMDFWVLKNKLHRKMFHWNILRELWGSIMLPALILVSHSITSITWESHYESLITCKVTKRSQTQVFILGSTVILIPIQVYI